MKKLIMNDKERCFLIFYFIYFPLSFTNGSSFNGSLLMQDYGSLI
uniref:Uncharacterized protein n=1 Tax=Candidatus Kentrum sp. UNK TaxID=2126344 RepID=A0A451AL35_9GAMM|nr:MAG: hypothetical protein BECKUNK1418G_GA0071005_110615 [Candidatus Kentron sp. UNK]VFK72200.1 MAG: hypothetical protein BECKUNK1418H_GA0071006_11016 [Candidatus Kentron sp. UNK]